MIKAALFCDETKEYRCPEEPDAGDEVRLRFRTAADDVERVVLVLPDENRRVELEKTASAGRFDYYETMFAVGDGMRSVPIPALACLTIWNASACLRSRRGFMCRNGRRAR